MIDVGPHGVVCGLCVGLRVLGLTFVATTLICFLAYTPLLCRAVAVLVVRLGVRLGC